ncbi:hypothetical protein OG883_24310 [Streptomyces sp. NBC_01142]|uniref:hypothetical protein n=1 Tax=Streptomyces sp. NBC_01142 TaxID=2975865 RepID=UPI00224D54DB|nr:hypothetical protein [Streptomyces sp. NBC_01142]MCX4822957.1 hypothetical protein [Streptomyces sp. NBC_01142]
MTSPIGSFVVDIRTGRVGRLMGEVGPRLLLRPVGGGREWECEPPQVRPATAAERISATTAYVNARSRGELP